MYVAEMMNECPLNTWGQNSRCTHAVSSTPEGPYQFADVSIQNWCHNPAIVVQSFPNGTNLWALFHIGDGTGGGTKNCTAASADPSDMGDDHSRRRLRGSPDAGSNLHIAFNPNGPFLPTNPLPSCNNPAPFLAKNGTWFIVCDGFQLYSASTIFGPWIHVTTIRSSNGNNLPGNYGEVQPLSLFNKLTHSLTHWENMIPPYPHPPCKYDTNFSEDPFFFIDPRGNWHVLYHVYRTGGAEAHNCLPGHDGSIVSGHYFSNDGFTWRSSAIEPYGNVIDLSDGTQMLVTTRERPKMIFNAAGDPTQ